MTEFLAQLRYLWAQWRDAFRTWDAEDTRYGYVTGKPAPYTERTGRWTR